MCHHWLGDRDRRWERELADMGEDDPEGQEPEPEQREAPAPTADD